MLATGAIENARLLLASNGGLGNRHDLAGRFFMEHPHFPAGRVVLRFSAASKRQLRSKRSLELVISGFATSSGSEPSPPAELQVTLHR